MAFRLPAAAPFRYHCTASTSSRATPPPVAYIVPSRNMTCALPPSPSRRSVCRKSPSSALTRHTSSSASVPGGDRRHALVSSSTFATGRPFEADDDVAEADPGLSGRTVGHRLEDERAVGVGEAERERQRQLQRIHLTPSQPFWVVGLAADLHRQLDEASLRLRRLVRRADLGRLPAGRGGNGLAADGRGGMRTMSMPESAVFSTRSAERRGAARRRQRLRRGRVDGRDAGGDQGNAAMEPHGRECICWSPLRPSRYDISASATIRRCGCRPPNSHWEVAANW